MEAKETIDWREETALERFQIIDPLVHEERGSGNTRAEL